MAIHLCRDYITQNITTANRPYIYAYILAIFMRRVLGFSYVGDTNFNINSVGTLLIATGDTTPTAAAPTFPPGNKAGINLGAQKEFFVSIPVGVRAVSSLDVGRILVLRSTSYPTFNSGLFIIIGFDILTNSYIIDYRTLGDKPPVEAADSMNWYLYEKDINCPTQGTGNTLKTSAQYRGDGNSTTPRVMLQSPHSTNYQVRICNESTADFAAGYSLNCPTTSVSLGFGGTVAGDFIVGGSHTHAPQWADSSASQYLGGAPGIGDGGGSNSTQFRVTMIGGDDGYGAAIFARRPGNSTQPTSFVCVFGLPYNEPLPLPINAAARLFTIGTGYMGNDNFGAREVNDMGLQAGIIGSILNTNSVSQGMSVAPFGAPVMCAASFWAYITGGGQNSGPQLDGSATDTPFINSTELLPLDLIQGTLPGWNSGFLGNAIPAYPLAPRLMGTIPYIYEGRANFGDFSPSTDAGRSFQHMRRGLYIPWNGPNIIP